MSKCKPGGKETGVIGKVSLQKSSHGFEDKVSVIFIETSKIARKQILLRQRQSVKEKRKYYPEHNVRIS